MDKNQQIAEEIFQAVGGKENVSQATHCMTRLRLKLVDESKAKDDTIRAIDGVSGVIKAGGQYQVIVGQNVPKVYDAFCQLSDLKAEHIETETNTVKEKWTARRVGNAILDYLSGSMTPVLPIMMAAGMTRAIWTILGPNMLGVMQPTDHFAVIINYIYETAFYFMPIFLGYSAAKKIGATPILGMLLGAILVTPSFMTAVTEGTKLDYLGLPVTLVNYSQSIIPILLVVWVLFYVERFFKKIIPDVLSTVFVPFLSIFVMLPLALVVLAPAGSIIGNYVSNGLIALGNANGFIGVALVTGFWQLLVMTGMHLVLISVGFNVYLEKGFENFILPSMAIAFIGAAGMAFGAMLRFKNNKDRSVALGYLVSAIVGGVTEPTLYGIGVRYKRPLVAMVIGGLVGGGWAGLTGVQYLVSGAPSFMLPMTFMGGSNANLINGTIALGLAFIVTAVLTYFFGFEKGTPALQKEGSLADIQDKKILTAPMDGEYMNLTEVPDDMFSQGLLGQGTGIKPSKGEVLAPISGTISVVAESKHAIGITTEEGIEILIHVGIDTVALKGEGFKVRVKAGDHVNRGELLMKFNLKEFKEKGVETISAMVITNSDQLAGIQFETIQKAKAGTKIGQLEYKEG